MKERLTSLDGLRGLAALAVMLSHMGVNPLVIVDSPIFMFIYRMFSAGSNAVQVLFVLSGFLMAYLYPIIPSAIGFIEKRYARIIPVYAVVVLYIWWTTVGKRQFPVWEHVVSLAVIALGLAGVWLVLEKITPLKIPVGKIVFGLFALFQLGFLLFSVTVMPKVLDGSLMTLSDQQRTTLVMISNLTLTVPFVQNVMQMSGVFWSLLPELLFYLVYPLVVVPLIAVSKKWGSVITLIITGAVIKVLLDLDVATLSLFALQSMFIGRATGFVVGVLVGSLYRSGSENKSSLWQKCQPILAHPLMSIATITLFFMLIGFEWGDAVYQVRHYLNMYYLALSVSIGLLVVTAIQEKSIAKRVFSNKVLVYLGLVSYSLYLIHSEVIHVFKNHLVKFVEQFNPPERVTVILVTVILCLLSVAVATFLFRVVEVLYFRKKTMSNSVSAESKSKRSKVVLADQPAFSPKPVKVVLGGLVVSAFFMMVYMGTYAPSLVMAHHNLPLTSLFFQPRISSSTIYSANFTATQSNLSVVFVGLDYVRDPQVIDDQRPQPVELVFKLFDEQGNLIFESQRSPRQVEGLPHFPFGFPAIVDSKGKKYSIELSLKNAVPSDEVYIRNHSDSLVTQYSTEKKREVSYFASLLFHRVLFSLSSNSTQFALAFVWVVVFLLLSKQKHEKS